MVKIILKIQEERSVRRVELIYPDITDAYELGCLIGEAVAAVQPLITTPNSKFLDNLQEGIMQGLPCHITGICKDEQ